MKDYIYIIIITILVFIIGILIVLNINSQKENSIKTNDNILSEKNTIDNKEKIVVDHKDNNLIKEDENKEEEEKYTNKDEIVIKTLEDTISNITHKTIDDKFHDSAKTTFINIVDFIFYDGTIKDVTFKELSNNGKQKVLNLANRIDIAIESKIPNYKDNISNTASSAYKSASELIKKGSSNLNNFLINKLSEDDYNSIVSAKTEILNYTKKTTSFVKDSSSKLLNESKTKLSDWYQKYRNS